MYSIGCMAILMLKLQVVLGVAGCFLSMVDEAGFPDEMHWSPDPKVPDPVNFQAGGVHEPAARAYWDTLPGLSKWVRHWVHNKIWFAKAVPHKVDHSAKNAASLTPGCADFEQEKYDFIDHKLQEMLRQGVVVELTDGLMPDVLTRLSIAPKPGGGSEQYRIILDMRPENGCYADKKVRMEHLAHFSTVFEPGTICQPVSHAFLSHTCAACHDVESADGPWSSHVSPPTGCQGPSSHVRSSGSFPFRV